MLKHFDFSIDIFLVIVSLIMDTDTEDIKPIEQLQKTINELTTGNQFLLSLWQKELQNNDDLRKDIITVIGQRDGFRIASGRKRAEIAKLKSRIIKLKADLQDCKLATVVRSEMVRFSYYFDSTILLTVF